MRESIFAASLVLLATTVPAGATLIATDHFLRNAADATTANASAGEYVASGSTNQLRRANTAGDGQNPTISGFNGAWTGNVTSGSLAVAQWTAEVGPIVAPQATAYQAGGRARFSNGTGTTQRRVERQLSTYAASNTYYISLTSQVLPGNTVAGGFVGVGFTNAPGTTPATKDTGFSSGNTMRGLLIGAYQNADSTTDYVVRDVGPSGLKNDVILSNFPQNDATGSVATRYTVVRLDFNDEPANALGNSKITVWQDPAASSLTSEADASNAAAPLVFRTSALTTNADLTQLTLLGVNWTKAASFDEPRLGTTWADVVLVPEPATAALCGLLGAAFVRRRRR